MEEKVRQEPGMSKEMFPRVENGMRNGEMRKVERGVRHKMELRQKKIKTGDIVLRSQPFAFVILATHR